MSTKSLLIELDSVHSRLIQDAAANGFMPCMARLMGQGLCKSMEYEIPLQVAAWNSSQTGLSAIEHQFISFDNVLPGSYRNTRGFEYGPALTRYWDYLSEAGKRVLIMNQVMAAPVKETTNGIHICNFATHVGGEYGAIKSHPAAYADELNRRFPTDLYHIEDWGSKSYLNPSRLVKSVCANLARKTQVYCEFIKSESWDHAHVGLDDLHTLGHALIHNLEEILGDESSVHTGDQKTKLFTACSALDDAIAEIIDAAGPNVNVACVTIGGIGCENTWSHQLDSLLALFGADGGRGQTRIYNRLGGAWNWLPHTARRWIVPLKTRVRDFYMATRRKTTTAFSMPLNEEHGCIRINLRGREPNGMVEPGMPYERLCAEITSQLEALREVGSGVRLVREVVHLPTRLQYDPVLPTSLPDLLVVWTRDKTIEEVELSSGACYQRAFAPPRVGDHVIDGMLILHGPEWQNLSSEKSCSVLDVAPTILRTHDQPIPPSMPGRPLNAGTSNRGAAA